LLREPRFTGVDRVYQRRPKGLFRTIIIKYGEPICLLIFLPEISDGMPDSVDNVSGETWCDSDVFSAPSKRRQKARKFGDEAGGVDAILVVLD
jgi:hypothetical protein